MRHACDFDDWTLASHSRALAPVDPGSFQQQQLTVYGSGIGVQVASLENCTRVSPNEH